MVSFENSVSVISFAVPCLCDSSYVSYLTSFFTNTLVHIVHHWKALVLLEGSALSIDMRIISLRPFWCNVTEEKVCGFKLMVQLLVSQG